MILECETWRVSNRATKLAKSWFTCLIGSIKGVNEKNTSAMAGCSLAVQPASFQQDCSRLPLRDAHHQFGDARLDQAIQPGGPGAFFESHVTGHLLLAEIPLVR
jgi:hypothetical protein